MSEHEQTRYTLLQRACNLDDEQAWKELVEYYRRFIFYILRKLGVEDGDVEDVAQQVLISLSRKLEDYDSSRAKFRTWLSAVIRNTALVYFRKQKSTRNHIQIFGEEYSIDALNKPSEIDQRIETEWTTYIAQLAMERVRTVFQGNAIKVFELSLDGLSAPEIGERTGLQVSSVYTLRKRVKKQLYLEIREIAADLEPA